MPGPWRCSRKDGCGSCVSGECKRSTESREDVHSERREIYIGDSSRGEERSFLIVEATLLPSSEKGKDPDKIRGEIGVRVYCCLPFLLASF